MLVQLGCGRAGTAVAVVIDGIREENGFYLLREILVARSEKAGIEFSRACRSADHQPVEADKMKELERVRGME